MRRGGCRGMVCVALDFACGALQATCGCSFYRENVRKLFAEVILPVAELFCLGSGHFSRRSPGCPTGCLPDHRAATYGKYGLVHAFGKSEGPRLPPQVAQTLPPSQTC